MEENWGFSPPEPSQREGGETPQKQGWSPPTPTPTSTNQDNQGRSPEGRKDHPTASQNQPMVTPTPSEKVTSTPPPPVGEARMVTHPPKPPIPTNLNLHQPPPTIPTNTYLYHPSQPHTTTTTPMTEMLIPTEDGHPNPGTNNRMEDDLKSMEDDIDMEEDRRRKRLISRRQPLIDGRPEVILMPPGTPRSPDSGGGALPDNQEVPENLSSSYGKEGMALVGQSCASINTEKIRTQKVSLLERKYRNILLLMKED